MTAVEERASINAMADRSSKPPPRMSRHVMPVGMRVLVRIIASADRSASGLFLPPGAKDATAEASYGEVVEVARAGTKASDENVSGIPNGSRVLFPKERGVPVPWDETLRVLDTKDVLAIVEEHPLDSAH